MGKYCRNESCQQHALNGLLAALISYVVSALALAVPFINSAGADVKATMTLTGINFSWLSLIIGGSWLVSGIIGSIERHTNAVVCVLHSLGFPGVILAILSAIK